MRPNSDEARRRAERAAAIGDTRAVVDALAGRLRRGEVSLVRVRIAAELGHSAAKAVLGIRHGMLEDGFDNKKVMHRLPGPESRADPLSKALDEWITNARDLSLEVSGGRSWVVLVLASLCSVSLFSFIERMGLDQRSMSDEMGRLLYAHEAARTVLQTTLLEGLGIDSGDEAASEDEVVVGDLHADALDISLLRADDLSEGMWDLPDVARSLAAALAIMLNTPVDVDGSLVWRVIQARGFAEVALSSNQTLVIFRNTRAALLEGLAVAVRHRPALEPGEIREVCFEPLCERMIKECLP